MKASLAPNMNKPYRVCDECYTKLKKVIGDGVLPRKPKHQPNNLNRMSNELAEKDSLVPKLQGPLSRLSSVDSFKSESRNSWQNVKFELNNSRPSPGLSESYQLGSSSLYGSSKKLFSAYVPSSRAASRSTSPVSCRPSPPHLITTPTISDFTTSSMVDDPKQRNDTLS